MLLLDEFFMFWMIFFLLSCMSRLMLSLECMCIGML